MNIFDQLRTHNASWYTAGYPLGAILQLSTDELTQLAQQHNLSVEQLRGALRAQATTPHVEMTCPLCGQAQTHLANCKGCGGDAFGYDLEQAYPPDADGITIQQHLRSALAAALQDFANEAQIQYAVSKAFQYGGCMVCADCWHMTSTNWHAYATCPLFLLHERILRHPHTALIPMFMDKTFQPEQWAQSVRAHWAAPAMQAQIQRWRNTLLDPVLNNLAEQTDAALKQEIEALFANLTNRTQPTNV